MVTQTAEREWRGIWIPKEVWLDERLNPLEKVILFEIDSLDKTDSGCFASNEYIAKFCQCSEWKVSNAITKLISLGYIRIAAFDGRKRTIKSCLGFSLTQPCEFPNSDLGISQDISIRDSNTSNKNKVSISSIDDDFSKFWSAYPRKDGKQDAIKAWKSIKPNKELQNVILNDLKRRVGINGVWYKSERRFIPLPATYLRGRRWEDEQGTGKVHEEPNYDYDPWLDPRRR